ncbi:MULTISPECIES: hypothetical protein [Rhizobium]|uniref:Uncharacterized protein n=1 Tax=Rhizobium rhododendri TaxID=2506430 RepID=A0ABY8ILD3_9HYPH|nr:MULTISPECIES: hypothetical protein [Rhizobium]MBZ5758413.1 hypothetical protein [Rhizobium sp. VS19-DR96]MBZ5764757.1 hypothetical protein [Rhizobium sp. VS19-DR129.2]MBZ5772300.1 hypothetical protein [Rhizobium sp. VS19-DRK62.2]MBZ5783013.1 hypothetical protein [Rhizobium sp. VS19-DR121]MBZ5800461.1 hypothetical protein [Rhizobium sp. VS19-DR181]
MIRSYLSDVIDHWTNSRDRALRQTNAATLRQMSHLPPHLVADVNARGFPPDTALPQTGTTATVNFSYGCYKIYSFE